MNSKRTQALIRTALIFGIVALVNFISIRLFTRLDLTEKNIYTLSDASKTLVANLDDRVAIKAHFTEDLPAPYNNNRRAVLDILNDYKAYARGNLRFEFINPEGERGEQEAQQEGIAPVQVQVINEDRLEVKQRVSGIGDVLRGSERSYPCGAEPFLARVRHQQHAQAFDEQITQKDRLHNGAR